MRDHSLHLRYCRPVSTIGFDETGWSDETIEENKKIEEKRGGKGRGGAVLENSETGCFSDGFWQYCTTSSSLRRL